MYKWNYTTIAHQVVPNGLEAIKTIFCTKHQNSSYFVVSYLKFCEVDVSILFAEIVSIFRPLDADHLKLNIYVLYVSSTPLRICLFNYKFERENEKCAHSSGKPIFKRKLFIHTKCISIFDLMDFECRVDTPWNR